MDNIIWKARLCAEVFVVQLIIMQASNSTRSASLMLIRSEAVPSRPAAACPHKTSLPRNIRALRLVLRSQARSAKRESLPSV
jgi:hypothetical protein